MARTTRMLMMILLMTLFSVACTSDLTEEQRIETARSQASELLAILRAGEFAKATDFVLLDDAVRTRFDLPKGIDRTSLAQHVEELFRRLYEDRAPGPVASVRVDPDQTGDMNLVQISYRHGDFDAFLMRLVDGRWLYSFE